ncbi:MAG: hypothetical protein P4L46_02655 [Fimbriimonas sp.]|nr:hypothetical protein [Fimbriimonas sp.]
MPLITLLLAGWLASPQAVMIDRVRFLPDQPKPYLLRDWDATAKAANAIFFDLHRKGPYLPLVWLITGKHRTDKSTFGMPSYVGNESARGQTGEAICQLGAILGSSAAKLDGARGATDWLGMSTQFFNPKEGLVLNNVGAGTDTSFWYVLLPSLDYIQLSLSHPDWKQGKTTSRKIADTWARGIEELDGNFDHTAYNFRTKKPLDNKLWIEPDAAAGVAYLELSEGLRLNDVKYQQASERALRFLEHRTNNPTYEVLTPYGALSAAYLNAEKGENWDVKRFTNWCFEPTAPQRAGWGMVLGNWGGLDVGGLMGSVTDGGGYAFAMNTFLDAANVAPIARYDARFSRDIAKWILNLANSARLFYGDAVPSDHQSSAAWKGDPGHGLAYEGLRRSREGKSPYATGDAVQGSGAKTDIGLYGSGYVGLLAALVHPTNVPMILRIDLRATDFLPVKAFPTDLYWNPYREEKTVTLNLGRRAVRLYDAIRHRYLTQYPVSGSFALKLAGNQAAQIVQVTPSNWTSISGNVTRVAGIAIDYNNGSRSRPEHAAVVPRDQSVSVRMSRAVFNSVGHVEWDRIASDPIQLSGGEGSRMRATLRFAWDDRYAYFRVQQNAPSTETIQAPSREELALHWWDFEDVVISLDPGRGLTSVASVPGITLGWSSEGQNDLFLCPDLGAKDLEVQTSGTAKGSNREIEGRISWNALNRAFGYVASGERLPATGRKLGCQPLLVDGTFRRQAYIGGARYTKPSGYDQNSRTLVLVTADLGRAHAN